MTITFANEDDQRRWLYTAITRAEKGLVILGLISTRAGRSDLLVRASIWTRSLRSCAIKRAFEVPSHFPSGQKKGKDCAWPTFRATRLTSRSCAIKLEGDHAGDWYEFDTSKGGGPIGTLSHATGLRGRFLIEYAAELSGWKVGDKKPVIRC